MSKTLLPREEIIAFLAERDGPDCFLCKREFIEEADITIEHWMPQSWCRANGWTREQIWDLSNLRLAHKPCNAKKGDLVPVDDHTVPKREPKQSVSRAAKRGARPEICNVCDSGRRLGPGDECGSCGSGPMPEAFPQWAKMKANECDHDLFWCWACSIGIIEREPAFVKVLSGDEL